MTVHGVGMDIFWNHTLTGSELFFFRGIVPITCDELFKAMNSSSGDIVSASLV